MSQSINARRVLKDYAKREDKIESPESLNMEFIQILARCVVGVVLGGATGYVLWCAGFLLYSYTGEWINYFIWVMK